MDNTFADQHETDLHLLGRWRATQDPKYFQQLYMSCKPDIEKAMKNAAFGSNLPQSAHKIWAAQAFHDALRTYSPDKGTKLRSHIYGAIQNKSKRLNYLYSNIGKQPEPRAGKVGIYQNEFENLKAELGRDPTAAELANRLGWTVRETEQMHKEVQQDLALDETTSASITIEDPKELETLHLLYGQLTPDEQKVYDCVLGKNGRPSMLKPNGRIDFERIGRTLSFSSSKVRVVLKSISTKYKRAA